ncbi:hypothetical protein N9Y14_00440 [Alphaproteobacteria bacterium]|nr:hypothetical protein [Alphaproteobacteria bacterium]MDA8625682.1 hypothetical protein [Alphaproteobacteria bacterium]MDA8642625.1 hypothetical protein [Alphaproteobacteria bacterium]MDA8666479.1 hypothetical protein [Alphaproteobacteria bacterium]MDB2381433.1 hypothetical protein [Alphaproteobacteria bacterium]
MRYFVLILAVLVAPLTAAAQGRNGLTIGAGSLGIEAIYTRNLNSYFDIVLGYSALDYNDTFTDDDGNSFTGSATIEAPRIGLQFFPLSFLNMEVGMVFGAPDLSIAARANEDDEFEIGNETYPISEIGYLAGDVDFQNENAPYVLLGIGRNVGGGLGLSFSIGAIQYGAPSVDLRTEDCNFSFSDLQLSATCLALAADVEAEERQVNADLDEFELWPFARIGLTYSF